MNIRNICIAWTKIVEEKALILFIQISFLCTAIQKPIQQLEQKVIDYEQALQRQAELLLQQERIKQEQRGSVLKSV